MAEIIEVTSALMTKSKRADSRERLKELVTEPNEADNDKVMQKEDRYHSKDWKDQMVQDQGLEQ